MARFDLCANRHAGQRRTLPFYVDVQADSRRHRAPRFVIALAVEDAFGLRIAYLRPVRKA